MKHALLDILPLDLMDRAAAIYWWCNTCAQHPSG
jgi:hypothetical protein